MDNRKLIYALLALVVVAAAAIGFSLTAGKKEDEPKIEFVEQKQATTRPAADACSSNATYARLKQVAFEEAVRIRNADPANLDTLATNSVVRMENPVVRSRDEAQGLTVCSGRFVLELPPGAERAFGGERRLTADIEYAVQAAADGKGSVFRMDGAEPLIYKLAAFQLNGAAPSPPETELADASDVIDEPAPPVDSDADEPEPTPAPRAAPRAEPKAAAPKAEPKEPARTERRQERERPVATARNETRERAEPPSRATARPSFNCRVGRSRSEQMVCNSDRLAAADRRMSAQFYSALDSANGPRRRELRRTRDRFLAYRERCRTEACIAEAYEGRMQEIRDIMEAE